MEKNLKVSDIIQGGEKVHVQLTRIKVLVHHDRTDVDDETIESLASSMSEVGLLNPILLDKKSDDEFDLISGLRRFEAANKLNWQKETLMPLYTGKKDIFTELDNGSRMI